jgi:hypothetical protein
MRKATLVLAIALAACFTLTGAEAKKRAHAAPKVADAAYDWNVKNVKSFGPTMPAAATTAAPKKHAKRHSMKKSKKA